MSAPRVFAGMFVTIIVFAIVTYWMTGSLVVTLLESIAALILLQLGYFLCVGFFVWKQAKRSVSIKVGEPAASGEDKHAHMAGAPFNQPGSLGN